MENPACNGEKPASNGLGTQEVDAEAQAQVWRLIYGFADSLVLRSSVELGIPDLIHENGGQATLSHLSSRLGLPASATDRLFSLLRFLINMKILDLSQPDGAKAPLYSLTRPAQLLLSGSSKTMVPMVLGMTHKDFMVPWHYIKDGLCQGPTAFEKAMGVTIWEYLERDLDKSEMFNQGMAGETRLLTSGLIEGCRDLFGGVESIVDVGGGNGTNLKAISAAFPHLKCTVFDLPHVVVTSVECPGINRVAGDMFKGVPSAQAIMLKLILHDWSDEDSIKILKKCKEAVPKEGGRVFIVDVVLDENSDHVLNKPRMVLDIDMMINTGGRERTEQDWKNLIFSAGYKSYKIRHIAAIQSVIEATPY